MRFRSKPLLPGLSGLVLLVLAVVLVVYWLDGDSERTRSGPGADGRRSASDLEAGGESGGREGTSTADPKGKPAETATAGKESTDSNQPGPPDESGKTDTHTIVLQFDLHLKFGGIDCTPHFPPGADDERFLSLFMGESYAFANEFQDWHVGLIDPRLLAAHRTTLEAEKSNPKATPEEVDAAEQGLKYMGFIDGRVWAAGSAFGEAKWTLVTADGRPLLRLTAEIEATLAEEPPETAATGTENESGAAPAPAATPGAPEAADPEVKGCPVRRWLNKDPKPGLAATDGEGWWFFDWSPDHGAPGPRGQPLVLQLVSKEEDKTLLTFEPVTVDAEDLNFTHYISAIGRLVRPADRAGVWLPDSTMTMRASWIGSEFTGAGRPENDYGQASLTVCGDGRFIANWAIPSFPMPSGASPGDALVTWTIGFGDGGFLYEDHLLEVRPVTVRGRVVDFGELPWPWATAEVSVDRRHEAWPAGGPSPDSVVSAIVYLAQAEDNISVEGRAPVGISPLVVGLPPWTDKVSSVGWAEEDQVFRLTSGDPAAINLTGVTPLVLKPAWGRTIMVRVMVGGEPAESAGVDWTGLTTKDGLAEAEATALKSREVGDRGYTYSAPASIPIYPNDGAEGYLLVAGASGYLPVTRWVPADTTGEVVVELGPRYQRMTLEVSFAAVSAEVMASLGKRHPGREPDTLELIFGFVPWNPGEDGSGDYFPDRGWRHFGVNSSQSELFPLDVWPGKPLTLKFTVGRLSGLRGNAGIDMYLSGEWQVTATKVPPDAEHNEKFRLEFRLLSLLDSPTESDSASHVDVTPFCPRSPSVYQLDNGATIWGNDLDEHGVKHTAPDDSKAKPTSWDLTIANGEATLKPVIPKPAEFLLLPARIVLDVNLPANAPDGSSVIATVRQPGSLACCIAGCRPGQSLSLWAPVGESWLEVHWWGRWESLPLKDDGEPVLLRKITVSGSSQPERIAVVLPEAGK